MILRWISLTEITAICGSAVDLDCAHTSSRAQFGRPLATFQAIRHRVAEAYVELEAARAALDAAWQNASAPDGGAQAARIAKLRAGRAQVVVFRHTLQVFGAVGLTMESDVHRHATRAAALDALLGGHQALAQDIGCEPLGGAAVDRLVEI